MHQGFTWIDTAVLVIYLLGVLLAGLIVLSVSNGGDENPLAMVGSDFADTAEMLGLAVFFGLLLLFSKIVLSGKKAS